MKTPMKILVIIAPEKEQQIALDKALFFAKQHTVTIQLLSG
jgi:hypothetical protein